MSKGRQIFEALRAQLGTITETAGYSLTIQKVISSLGEMTFTAPQTDLPLIEIIGDNEVFEHGASAGYWSHLTVILFLVAPKEWEDGQMEDFKADVIKCLFGGTSDASGNTGVTLGGVVQSIHLENAQSDLNMIESNRTYVMRIKLSSKRVTYVG